MHGHQHLILANRKCFEQICRAYIMPEPACIRTSDIKSINGDSMSEKFLRTEPFRWLFVTPLFMPAVNHFAKSSWLLTHWNLSSHQLCFVSVSQQGKVQEVLYFGKQRFSASPLKKSYLERMVFNFSFV